MIILLTRQRRRTAAVYDNRSEVGGPFDRHRFFNVACLKSRADLFHRPTNEFSRVIVFIVPKKGGISLASVGRREVGLYRPYGSWLERVVGGGREWEFANRVRAVHRPRQSFGLFNESQVGSSATAVAT